MSARCVRCGGVMIEDARDDERFCLACGSRPVDAEAVAAAVAHYRADTDRPEGSRFRSPRIGGIKLG